MSVHDLWKDLSKVESAERRKNNRDRWQRRWHGPDVNPSTGRLRQHKRSYKEPQKAQAYLDDAQHRSDPKTQSVRDSSVTVRTLLDRHLAAKSDRAPKTVAADAYHASVVREEFGDRHVSTLEPTEIEVWTQRPDPARSSRKKQLEILRAAIKRGVRDKIVDDDPTDGLVVALGHKELPHWSSDELMAVIDAAPRLVDRTLLALLGLMGMRSGEARSLLVGDFTGTELSVLNSGGGTDTTKTRASRRTLPVPSTVLPWLTEQAGDRPKGDYLFPSPRKKGEPIGKRYVSDAVTRAVSAANVDRTDPIPRINVHGLRHTFAAIALSEAGADVLSVSRAMGHARPSITLDRYGHLAPSGLGPLMEKLDVLLAA